MKGGIHVSGSDHAPPITRRQREWLRAEVGRWRADGLIAPDQEEQILARYPDPDEGGRTRTTAVFTILGALLLGIGAILFIAHNWWAIPRGVKLTLILAVILLAHGSGYWLWHVRGTYPRLGHALVLLGTLLYGAGIWLVAQMYHLRAHWPQGILYWALGSLPVAYSLNSRPVLALAALLLGLWTAFDQGARQAGTWLFPPLFAALVGPAAYRLRAPESLALGAAGLGIWTFMNAMFWSRGIEEFGAMVGFAALAALGAALFGVSLWHDLQPRLRFMAPAYLYAGLILGLIGVYALSFRWDPNRRELVRWDPAILISLLAAAAVVALALAVRRDRSLWPAAAGGAAVLASGLVVLVQHPVAQVAAANLVLLGVVAGLVAWGFREQRAGLVNVGLVAFVIQVVTRYFDLFWTLLDRSLFFMVGGVLLLAGGTWLERSRRRWLRDLKGGVGHAG